MGHPGKKRKAAAKAARAAVGGGGSTLHTPLVGASASDAVRDSPHTRVYSSLRLVPSTIAAQYFTMLAFFTLNLLILAENQGC